VINDPVLNIKYCFVDEICVLEDFVCVKQELKNCWLLRQCDYIWTIFKVHKS